MRKLISFFIAHNTEMCVRDGRLWIAEWFKFEGEFHCEWIDATDWTLVDARNWMGY